jgi:hypothetical protein
MLHVAAAIHHQHVAGPQRPERMVNDGPVHSRHTDRDCGAGHPHVLGKPADRRIHEAGVQEMADRRRLGPGQQVEQSAVDLGRQLIDHEHR